MKKRIDKLNICKYCGRGVRGNAIHVHMKACRGAFTVKDLAEAVKPKKKSEWEVGIFDDSTVKLFKLVTVRYQGRLLFSKNKMVRMTVEDAEAFKAKLES